MLGMEYHETLFFEIFIHLFYSFQQKTLHKEELTQSNAEKNVRKNIQTKASQMQKRKTEQLTKASDIGAKGSPTKVYTWLSYLCPSIKHAQRGQSKPYLVHQA